MKSLNLYTLSRLCGRELESFVEFEALLARRRKKQEGMRKHEKDGLAVLVEFLLQAGATVSDLDGFYCAYKIPQIGKEFDLLRICDDFVLNIEQKSQSTGTKALLDQLKKNKYYLSHLARPMALFVFVADTSKLFRLSDDDQLTEMTDASQLLECLRRSETHFDGDLDTLFHASKFLVSPINSPKLFLEGCYFLTQHQKEIKDSICNAIDAAPDGRHQFFAITGGAGTGKTLLLYDIARKLCEQGPVCVIHCGRVNSGHEHLKRALGNLDIFSPDKCLPVRDVGMFVYRSDIDLTKYDYILVDEAQRMYAFQLNFLSRFVRTHQLDCIFCLDKRQMLSRFEENDNSPAAILTTEGIQQFELTNRIRINHELASFTNILFDLADKLNDCTYQNIDLVWAHDDQEAMALLDHYRQQDYTYIYYTKYPLLAKSCQGDFSAHDAVGQEFDNVVMLIDQSFRYQDGSLVAKPHPNDNYDLIKLLYQGITRTRNKLCLIIVDNQPLFDRLLSKLRGQEQT